MVGRILTQKRGSENAEVLRPKVSHSETVGPPPVRKRLTQSMRLICSENRPFVASTSSWRFSRKLDDPQTQETPDARRIWLDSSRRVQAKGLPLAQMEGKPNLVADLPRKSENATEKKSVARCVSPTNSAR